MKRFVIGAALAVFCLANTANADEAMIAAGEQVFKKCGACHAVGEGAKNKVGPELNDLFGRKPGTVEGYRYSKAMIEFGQDKEWNEELLKTYLHAPKDLVKGTKMSFAGLKEDEDIDNLLAYLKTFDPEEKSGS